LTTFVVIAALLVVVALAWVVPPLLRGSHAAAVDRTQMNLAILRDQLAELDAELARGALSPEQHAESRAELERRALDETAAPVKAPTSRGGRIVAAFVVVLVPLASAALYLTLGDPGAFDPGSTQAQSDHTKQPSPEQIEAMLARMAQRLQNEPDNVEGWSMLARSYYVMRRYADAVGAYERLVKLVPADPGLLTDYADALAMREGRRIAGRPLELVQQALKLDPNNLKALAMAGTEAFDRKDYKGAVEYWERLRAAAPPDSEIGRNVTGSINEARALGGLGEAPPVAAATAAAPAARVQGTVRLDPALAARTAPNDTVFVFARAAAGPRVPLAVLTLRAADLPAQFALDDSMAMSPQFKLSGQKSVLVSARVSKSGRADSAPGDLEAEGVPVPVGASGVVVTIDRVVP
jgi:cytochrome c-type biogenesis protein CcmH